MIVNIRFYLLPLILISLLSASLVHSASKKNPDTAPGIIIEDDAGLTVSQGLTDIIIDGNEVILQVSGNVYKAWSALQRALRRLGVPLVPNKSSSTGRLAHVLKTNWISWNVDMATGKGVSENRLLDALKGKNRERHKFLFSVLLSADNTVTLIQVVDVERQEETDIAPDSIFEWKERPPQTEAAHSFLRRIQGVYELALTSHLIVPDLVRKKGSTLSKRHESEPFYFVEIPNILKPYIPGSNIFEMQHFAPVIPSAITSPMVLKPKDLEPTILESEVSEPAKKEVNFAETTQSVQRQSIQRKPEQPADKEKKKVILKEKSTSKNSVSKKAKKKLTQGTLSGDNALWIQKKNDETWDAVLKNLEKFEISIQMKDPTQMILSTGWLDYFYEKKNQSLKRYSRNEPSWALNLMGDGRERHRIQLTVLPTNQGRETLIYAFHTGSQKLTDQTPDSSQTNLAWEDRETQDKIAAAFLRLLSTRLIVP